MNKKTIIFEMMAKGHHHNQYMYGCYKYYQKYLYKYYIDKTSLLVSYTKNICRDKIDIKKISYENSSIVIFFKFIYFFFSKKYNLVISGAPTYFLIFPVVFFFYNKVDIHLHGQFFGSKNNMFKRFIWKIISSLQRLHLCCPFYKDKIQIKKCDEILILPENTRNFYKKIVREGKRVGIIAGNKGRHNSKGLNFANKLAKFGYEIVNFQKPRILEQEWIEYKKFILNLDYIFLNPTNDYYHYSPSGALNDSYNFNIPLLSFSSNEYVKSLLAIKDLNIEFID